MTAPVSVGDWIQTYSGIRFDPLKPDPKLVEVVDIAHSLSLQCRYNGHTHQHYSVAEHSVLVADAILRDTGETGPALRGLLHDAAEAYIGDVVRPLKQHLPFFTHVEDKLLEAIGTRLYVPLLRNTPPVVKDADLRILLDERTALLEETADWVDWGIPAGTEPLGVRVEGWAPRRAELQFYVQYAVLEPSWRDRLDKRAVIRLAQLGFPVGMLERWATACRGKVRADWPRHPITLP